MADRPSLRDRTKEFSGQAATLAVSDPLGSLLVKSFDLLGHLQKDNLAATELDFGLQSLDAQFDLLRRNDQIAPTPLRSVVIGLVESLHGTVQSMRNEGMIKLSEKEEHYPDDDHSISSGVAETRSSSDGSPMEQFPVENTAPEEVWSSVQQVAAAAAPPFSPPLNLASLLAAATAADATTKARGARQVLPSTPSPSISRVGDRPRRSGVKPAGYWSRDTNGPISSDDDDCVPSTSAAAAAASRALLPVPSAAGVEKSIFGASIELAAIKEEFLADEEGMEVDVEVKNGEVNMPTDCCFSDIEDDGEQEEREQKPLVQTTSPFSQRLQLLLATPPTPAGLPSGSYSTIEDNGRRLFRCEICLKTHTYFHNLKAHMRSHTGERRFGCDACGTRFFRMEHLQRHQKGQCSSRPHLCTICGKRFAEEETLRDHLMLHSHRAKEGQTGEEGVKRQWEKNEQGEYQCPHCTRAFKFGCHIERHARIHTGDYPFRCADCGRGFVQMTAFVQHKRIHSGSLPFACSHCDSRFRTLGTLNVHLRKTHGLLIYVCQTCGEKFARSCELKEHRLRHTEKQKESTTVTPPCPDHVYC